MTSLLRYIAWHATAIHTCASSYIHLTASATGRAAEQAAERKSTKYSTLPATHDFIPVAIESLGPINSTRLAFLQELGRRMTEDTSDPSETTYLFQRLSVCTQRFNAVALSGRQIMSVVGKFCKWSANIVSGRQIM